MVWDNKSGLEFRYSTKTSKVILLSLVYKQDWRTLTLSRKACKDLATPAGNRLVDNPRIVGGYHEIFCSPKFIQSFLSKCNISRKLNFSILRQQSATFSGS